MKIEIRDVNNIAEIRATERLQIDVWGGDGAMVVPDHLLVTAQKNGGLLLGAFTPDDELVGFVFGFIGLTSSGQIKHCSHMAGVHPKYRDLQLGERLKMAQREAVLAQGIEHITWTYDPLESRNARLNFHKLGAVCNTYYRNAYGKMSDDVNAGMPSDRFEVDWWLNTEPILARVEGHWRRRQLSELDATVVNVATSGEFAWPAQKVLEPAGPHYLIEIPPNIHQIKRWNMELALEWRLHSREMLENGFNNGYKVIDFLYEGGRSYYLMSRQ